MFAIFLSDKMDPFYAVITSFPTVIFSFLLIFCFLYWLVAVLGLIEFDFLDFDIPDNDVDLNPNDSLSNVGVLAGLLMRLGLAGIPFPLILSAISLIGWFICYYICFFAFPFIPGKLLEVVAGIPIFFFVLYSSAWVTGKVFKPLRPIFKAADQDVQKQIVGKIGVVRTTRVDQDFGEANVADGGAGLIVKVRSYKEESFKRGDRVVLLEYDKIGHLYKVIAESEFNK